MIIWNDGNSKTPNPSICEFISRIFNHKNVATISKRFIIIKNPTKQIKKT